jgi:hypothetical protein
MRRRDKKRIIQEANERLEKRYLNEDVTDGHVIDPMDSYHSEDPKQVNMFTQQAGDKTTQMIKQFIGDNNLVEKIKTYQYNMSSLTNEWPNIIHDFYDLVSKVDADDSKYQDSRGENLIENLQISIEDVNTLSQNLEDALDSVYDMITDLERL